jgi:hypothetical protein
MSIIHWRSYFNNILPDNVNGIVVVFYSTCNGGVTNHVTFDIDGSTSRTRMLGDDHDRRYERYRKFKFMDIDGKISDGTPNGTLMDFNVYPSEVGADR